ncbi:MAG: amino acid adenylation domain-containing protein, partial [bacterium]|nr:amino acid adenylation domain-containing protein [bacterium]
MAYDPTAHSRAAFAAIKQEKEKKYWLNKLTGELKKTGFPYDHKQPVTQQRKEEAVSFEFPPKTVVKLTALSKGKDYRFFMTLAAGVVALLYRYSGEEDIIVGCPVSKQDSDGDFINTILALRTPADDKVSFKELLLERVRPTILEANEHQNYPMNTLLNQLNITGTGAGFPLFDVAVLFDNIHEKKYILHTQPNILFSFHRDGERLEGRVEYNSDYYNPETVEQIVRHYRCLMETALFNPDTPIAGIDLLSAPEKHRLMVDFNGSRSDYPSHKTIHDVFRSQAARLPRHFALAYEGRSVTYKELDHASDGLAAHLRSIGVESGEPVALMFAQPGLGPVALLGILKAGAAFVPINPDYPGERKKFILKDCNVKRLLTDFPAPPRYSLPLTVINLDEEGIYRGEAGNLSSGNEASGSRDLAYIMYTSGSTGTPKGVMIEHRSVLRLTKNNGFMEPRPDDSVLLTGTFEFDASTAEIWGALLNGLTLNLVNQDILLDPDLLKQAIRQSRATMMWMTVGLFNRMVDADVEMFGSLRFLVVGGDLASPSHFNRLRNRFPRIDVFNGYGPTENTTLSTIFPIRHDYHTNIPIGKPLNNSTVYILDHHHHLVPIGVSGQLYVGGDGLARGYLNQPRLTAEKFDHDLKDFQDDQDLKEEKIKIYATGDLARWLSDGNIEFLGRVDHQVKIRGYRVEPGEIENCLMAFDTIKEALVIHRQTRDGEKYLCAYFVPNNGKSDALDRTDIHDMLAESLPEYMIPSYFVQLQEFPLNPNGKVDRKSLPEPGIDGFGPEYTAPRTPVEIKMTEIWAELLELDPAKIGIDSDFFRLGGHSMNATRLISKIYRASNVKIHLSEMFKRPTIRQLAQYVDQSDAPADPFSALQPVEQKEYYPLSSAQKRLYVLHQMDLNSIGYNIPMVMTLKGKPDPSRLREAFRTLIKRHESLRTSFQVIEEEPVQRVRDHVGFEIEWFGRGEPMCSPPHGNMDGSKGSHGGLPLQPQRDFIRPFDLAEAPLMRVGLMETENHGHLFMIDMHHIITDGPSIDLLVKEFILAYDGKDSEEELPPLKFRYKDYTRWQNRKEHRENIKRQEAYWLKRFEGEIPVLELPTDYPRPAVRSFDGGFVTFELSSRQTRELQELARQNGASLFMVLQAVYNIFLSRITGQEDIVLGTPTSGRSHDDLEHIIGMFVNALAIRNRPEGNKTFSAFLEEIKTNTLDAIENQDYPFEDLVELVTVNRDTSRTPLFDALITFNEEKGSQLTGNDLIFEPCEMETDIEKFDLTLVASESGDSLHFTQTYRTQLFKAETIHRFARYFKNIVSGVVANPDVTLSSINILPEDEKRQILYDFNDTGEDFPTDKTIHELFEVQVSRNGDEPAVAGFQNEYETAGGDGTNLVDQPLKTLTYNQLNDKAGTLAQLLIERGVTPGSIIGLLVNRSIEMITGMLGILKAGGAYLPLNPQYPAERIDYMLKDSNAKLLVTTQNLNQDVKKSKSLEFKKETAVIFADTLENKSGSAAVRSLHSDSSNPAYVIYTSGTTGRPKGVLITHANFSPFLHWGYKHMTLGTDDRALQYLAYYFDWSVWEIFITLTSGASLYTVPDALLISPADCIAFINKHRITVLHVTPTQYSYLMDLEPTPKTLKFLCIGAEAFNMDMVRRGFQSIAPGGRILNHYGPTEATIVSAIMDFKPDELHKHQHLANVPIGKPMANVTLRILDKYGNPCPINVVGELLIGGDGVSRGYLNNPELTLAKFVDSEVQTNRFYKTGDRARWLPDGNIEFLGRIDHQVKIRGFRIELGEIENQLLSHEGIKDTVVMVMEAGGGSVGKKEEQLAAYVVPSMETFDPRIHDMESDSSGIRDFLKEQLPEYMIPHHFVLLEQLPLNANGKVDRRALPNPLLKDRFGTTPPSGETQTQLAAIWAGVLNIPDSQAIDIDDNFFDMGGHSLKATILTTKIHKEFQVRIPLVDIFQHPDIRRLSQYIDTTAKDQYLAIHRAEEKEYYPLSSAQKRLYLLYCMAPDYTVYNMPAAVILEGEINKTKLENTFKRLIARHQSLRTSLHMVENKPIQKVHHKVAFQIEFPGRGERTTKCSPLNDNHSNPGSGNHSGSHGGLPLQDFIRPFDLSQPPPMRVKIVETGKNQYILMLDMHHI